MHLYDVKVPYISAGFNQKDLIEEEQLEAKKYNMKIKVHDAISDVLVLKMFLKRLFFRAKETYSLKNSEVMSKLVELSNRAVKLKMLLFGKYKGMSFEDIFQIDRGYLEWLLREQDKMGEKCDKDIKYTIMELLK